MVVTEDGKLPLPWLAPTLSQALAMDKSHAVLFHASAGDGALQFALTLAQSWLCESGPAGRGRFACGGCGACRQVAARAHPDLKVLLPESLSSELGWMAGDNEADASDSGKSKRKPSRQIRIDAVRAAIDWMATTSSRGRGKVMLIHPADALNLQSANALLKTLEEPPQGARLILTTRDPEHLLPTVRSRCQRLRLPVPDHELARQWLGAQGEEDADVLLRAVDGHPLEAAAQVALGMTAARWNALPGAVRERRAAYFADWPLPRVVDGLLKFVHDTLALTVGGSPRYFDAAALRRSPDLPGLLAWKAELTRIARQSEHPWSEPLLVEAMLCSTRGLAPGPALDTLRP
jgi:DNA polymerase-3 subunit delta'